MAEPDEIERRVLRVQMKGPDVKLGKVAAADVAHLLLGVEQAVARATGHLLGRQLKATGRRGAVIERLTRLRLRAIRTGSVTTVMELPPVDVDAGGFDFDVATVGEAAIERALDVAVGVSNEQDIAKAWADVLDEIGIGDRIATVTLEHNGRSSRRVARLDAQAQKRLAAVGNRQFVDRPDSLTGVLVEADFEKQSARLRSVGSDAVLVAFDEDLADGIQEALRQQAEFQGEVVYDPVTSRAVSVRLHKVTRADQLPLGISGPSRFWDRLSLDELVREQGVHAIENVEVMRDTSAKGDDVDAFMAALGIEA